MKPHTLNRSDLNPENARFRVSFTTVTGMARITYTMLTSPKLKIFVSLNNLLDNFFVLNGSSFENIHAMICRCGLYKMAKGDLGSAFERSCQWPTCHVAPGGFRYPDGPFMDSIYRDRAWFSKGCWIVLNLMSVVVWFCCLISTLQYCAKCAEWHSRGRKTCCASRCKVGDAQL